MTIAVRELLHLAPYEIIDRFYGRGPFSVEFEDGVVLQCTAKRIVASSFYWEIHRRFPLTPIYSRHYIESLLSGEAMNQGTPNEIMSTIVEDVWNTYGYQTPEDREPVDRVVYDVLNAIHNDGSKIAESCVSSIDLLDFRGIVRHPKIREIVENIPPASEYIHNAYDEVMTIVKNDPGLRHNGLARTIRAKGASVSQTNQCVVVRGFATEVDGKILNNPIMTNFTLGMNTVYNLAAEARSAAKSLYFSDAPLQDAEYFARRLQLLCMVVEKIDYCDCGSTEYVEWHVKPPVYDHRGKRTYPGDLEFMHGKYYLDEETKSLKMIRGKEKHLYGKNILIRSVVHCKHSDPHKVCEVCFGGLAKNVSRFANLGHLCAATMTQQSSQSVLSNKHLDASSVAALITLDELAKMFFSTDKDRLRYFVNPEFKSKKPKLVVSREEVMGLTDILSADSLSNINPLKISAVECVDFVYSTDYEEISMPIFVSQGNRHAIFTTEFLNHLKIHKWDTDSKNNFVFDLSSWNFSLPILRLPEMEYSYSDHSHQIARVIESSIKNITDRHKPQSAVHTLQELFVLVNTKLNVNIAALEVIIYALTTADRDNFALGRNSPNAVLGVSNLIIANRSLGASLAFEQQYATLTNPRSFFKENRPDTVFDTFVAPKEVIEHYTRKQVLWPTAY